MNGRRFGLSLPLVAALVALTIGLRSRTVLGDPDPYSHIAAGKGILEHRAVPTHDPYYGENFDIAPIPQNYLNEDDHYFHTNKDLEGRRVQTVGGEKSQRAMRVINDSIERYAEKYLLQGP